MKHRLSQPTPLTGDQIVRLRTLDRRLILTSFIVTIAAYAWSTPTRPFWPLLLFFLVAFLVQVPAILRFRKEVGIRHHQPLIPPYPILIQRFAAHASFLIATIPVLLTTLHGHRIAAHGYSLFLSGFVLGCVIIGLSRVCFRSIPPACQHCRYPIAGRTLPGICPECGVDIDGMENIVTHEKIRKPGIMMAGIACITLTLVFGLRFMPHQNNATMRLTHNQRLTLAPTDAAAFGSLFPHLTTEDQSILIDGILAARFDGNANGMHHQIGWLEDRHLDGTMTPKQSDRFASEGYQLAISTRGDLRVGQPIRITLTGSPPHHPRRVRFLYFSRGFLINDEPLLIDPHTPYVADHLITAASLLHNLTIDRILVFPDARFTPQTSGDSHITTRIVAITTPPGVHPTITWHDDGTYTITPEPLTTHELNAETTITIAPPEG